MKRMIRFLLTTVLAAMLMVMPVMAEGATSVSIGSAEGEISKTVTVNIDIHDNVGFMAGRVTLDYDESALKLVDLVNDMFKGEANPASGIFNHASSKPVTGDGTLATATFEILDTAVVGNSYTVSASASAFRDGSGNELSVNGGSGTITVICNHDEVETVTDPTCGKDGLKTYTCSKCGVTTKDSVTIPATGAHTYEATATTEPTCGADGVKTLTCSVCGDTKEETIPAIGNHDITGVTGTATKEPTCTESGVLTFTCKVCGNPVEKTVDPLGHKYGDWTVTKAPTCSKGEESRTCSVCGNTETRALEATGHNITHYGHDADAHWAVCSYCGDQGREAHSFENSGMCKCGYQKPVEETPDQDNDTDQDNDSDQDNDTNRGNEPELDDEPKTGDVTMMLSLAVAAVICGAIAAGYACKRRIAK